MPPERELHRPTTALFTGRQFDAIFSGIQELAQSCANEFVSRTSTRMNSNTDVTPPISLHNPTMEGKTFFKVDQATRQMTAYTPIGQAALRRSLELELEAGAVVVYDLDDQVPRGNQAPSHVYDIKLNEELEGLRTLTLGGAWSNEDLAHRSKSLTESEIYDTSFMSDDEELHNDEAFVKACIDSLVVVEHDNDDAFIHDADKDIKDVGMLTAPQDATLSNDTKFRIIDNSFFLKPAMMAIWDSEKQRDNALEKHLAVIGHQRKETGIPGIFTHGVRFIRDNCGSDADSGEPDARQCRTIIVTNLPDSINLGTVLAQLRGELIIKALLVPGHKAYGPKAAVVHFSKHQCAQKIFDHYQSHSLYFLGGDDGDQLFSAAVLMPETDSYPLSEYTDHIISYGKTRHIEFHMNLGDLWAILQCSGLGLQHFGNIITDFTEVDDQCYRVELCSLQVAENVQRAYIRTIKHARETESRDSAISIMSDNSLGLDNDGGPASTVKFIPDSCNQDMGTLPTLPHSILNMQLALDFQGLLQKRQGIRLIMSEETCGDLHAHHPIPDIKADGWYMENQIQYQDHLQLDTDMDKTADWSANDIKHWVDANKEGRLCRWSEDPRSGARQFEVFLKQDGTEDGDVATPTMYREDFIREWIYYNLDSDKVETQEALDNYFEAHGLLNLRKVNQYVRARKVPPSNDETTPINI